MCGFFIEKTNVKHHKHIQTETPHFLTNQT